MPASPAATTDAPRALLVFTSLPDAASAETLASALIGRRLAACVNILAPCTSVYRWQGAIERAQEVQLVIKTVEDRWDALCAAVTAAHPYAVPELLALPVAAGLPAYLDWIVAETRGAPDAS